MKLKVKFAPDSDALRELREEIKKETKGVLRNNFFDIRPFFRQAVDAGVEASRNEFIPTPREVGELGIGKDGSEDTKRTQGAYKQLRTDGGFTKFSVVKQRPTARDNLLGAVIVSVEEEAFLDSELAKVPTPDSEAIDEIPWMRWLIFGAPTNPNFRFVNRRPAPKTSRTGRGIMVEGGIWAFPPARQGAFKILFGNIEKRVVGFIQEELGDIL